MDAPDQAELSPPSPITRREAAAFACLLLALECVYFAPALRPDRVLSAADWLLATESFRDQAPDDFEPSNRLLTDVACQMEPWLQLAAREWRAGRVPLWNPYSGGGAPLLANAQSAVFYPLHFIYFLTESPHAWVVIAIVKLFIAGMGAFLLAGELELGRLARWFAGLSFAFSGFVIVWLQYPMGSAAVWLPVVLWLVERLVKLPCALRAGWLAMAIAMMLLAGHPETAAHVLVVSGVYVLWRAEGPRGRLFVWFAVANVAAFLIAAVQLVPLAEYLKHSQEWTERSSEVPNVFELRRPDLLATPALVAPYIYGSYLAGHPHVEKAVEVENFNETAGGFTGLATVALLVPLGLLARQRHRWITFWLVFDVVCLAAVYRIPPVDNLLRIVPVLNVTQNQRLLLVVSLIHCLMGAAGLEMWRELVARPRWRLTLGALLFFGAATFVVAAIAVRAILPKLEARAIEHFETQAALRELPAGALQHRAEKLVAQSRRFFPRYYLSMSAYSMVLASVVLLAARWDRLAQWGRSDRLGLSLTKSAHLFPAVLAAFVLGELFCFGRRYNPAIPRAHYFPACGITQFLRDQMRDGFPFRVLVLEEEFPPNVLARYSIADLRNYDAIEVRRQLEFWAPLWSEPGHNLSSTRWTTWDRVAGELSKLRMANVRYVISTRAAPPHLADVSLVYRHGRVGVYEIAGARAFSFAPGSTNEAESELQPLAGSDVEYAPGRIAATVQVPEPGGLVIVAETTMPGWVASVDGQHQQIADGPFVSVSMPTGVHRLEFRYEPRSFNYASMLSIVAVSLTLGVVCLAGRWRRRETRRGDRNDGKWMRPG